MGQIFGKSNTTSNNQNTQEDTVILPTYEKIIVDAISTTNIYGKPVSLPKKYILRSPIEVYKKDNLIKHVMTLAINSLYLKNITSNGSCEGGFDLPQTTEWFNIITSDVKKYHQWYRQLRFIEEKDMIIGLRYKDCIQCWLIEEIDELLYIIGQFK